VTSRKRIVLATLAVVLAGIGSALLIVAARGYSSPRSHTILWYWQAGVVYQYDLQSRTSRRVALPAKGKVERASLSHNAQQIAYADDEGLKIAPTDLEYSRLIKANEPTKLVGSGFPYTITYTPLDWSPDGNWLLVHKGDWEIYYVYLASVQDGILQPVVGEGQYLGCDTGLSWAPDSSNFATSLMGVGFCNEPRGGIFVASTGDLRLKNVFSKEVPFSPVTSIVGGTSDVKWDPKGERIAFIQASWFPRQPHLLLVSRDGSQVQTVQTSNTDRLHDPIWSSDGKRIFYVDQTDDNGDTIYVVDLGSLAVTKLYHSLNLHLLSISPHDDWLVFTHRAQQGDAGENDLLLLRLTNLEVIQVASPSAGNANTGVAGWEMTTR
jgi:Tol biopolymer transport system component